MDKDRQRAKELTKALPFKEKISNFWFYYRTHTIVLIFAMVVLAWSAVQCASRIDYDLDISFYSEYYIPEENLAAFDEFMEAQIEDINVNGSIDARAYLYTANITGEYFDQNAQAVITRLQNEIATGECPAYLVDESFKNYMEETFGELGVIESVIEISSVPVVKETLKPADNVKLYWISIVEYEGKKQDAKEVLERKNMDIIKNYFAEN